MVATTWDEVEEAIAEAVAAGKLADWRNKLPSHKTKRFRQRLFPGDILGDCTHHNGSANQDPRPTASYHVGPNHISETGCPGICYTAGISQIYEPDKVLLFRPFQDATWSQDKPTKGHEEWAGDENRHLCSTLVFGDFDEDWRKGKSGSPSASQLDRWLWWMEWKAELFGYGPRGRFGHYHFGKSACPGRVLRHQIESARAGVVSLTDLEWQQALLRWDLYCLPKYGADGIWGYESKRALVAFERAHKHRVDGMQDPFTELLLARKYPAIP